MTTKTKTNPAQNQNSNAATAPVLVLGATGKTDFLAYLFTEVLDRRNAHVADSVRRALGRDPRDFRDHVREASAVGAWNE